MAEVKSYHAGQLISQEEAWQCSLSMKAAADHCYNCLESISVSRDVNRDTSVTSKRNNRCSGCLHARYCSLECQKKDWNDTHKLICPALKRLVVQHSTLAARALLILRVVAKFVHLPASVHALLELTARELALRREEIQQKPRELQRLRKLMRSMLDLLGLKESAISFADYLNIYVRVEEFAIYTTGSQLEEVGQGIYLYASNLEHSCVPNAGLAYVGKSIRVVALKNVENLEQVRISYISLSHPLERRKKELKDEFYYECGCVLCLDPAKDAERFCMPCINVECDAKIPSDQRANLPCVKCGVKPAKNRQKEFGRVYDQVCRTLKESSGLNEAAICRMQEKMSLVFHSSQPIWVTICLLKAYAPEIRETPERAVHFRRALDLYRAFLSPWDLRMGWCALNAVQLDAPAQMDSLVVLEEACRVLNAMLGEDHEMAREAVVKYKKLRDRLD